MNAEQNRIEEEAAGWVVRLDGGRADDKELRKFETWLAADPAHRAAFDRYQEVCDETGVTAPLLAEVSPVGVPDIPKRRSNSWRGIRLAIAASLAAAAAWYAYDTRRPEIISTQAAQRSIVNLSDGSRVELNAQTILSTSLRGGERVVRLTQGEAYFNVAKDAEHPFTVETPSAKIRVTGTAFNVRLKDGTPEVTLIEGAVTFSRPNSGDVALLPNEQITSAGAKRSLSPADIATALAWREGRIVLNGLTVAEAAERFASFHGKRITVSEAVANTRLGGTYSMEDLRAFFTALEDTQSINVVDRGDGAYAIVPDAR